MTHIDAALGLAQAAENKAHADPNVKAQLSTTYAVLAVAEQIALLTKVIEKGNADGLQAAEALQLLSAEAVSRLPQADEPLTDEAGSPVASLSARDRELIEQARAYAGMEPPKVFPGDDGNPTDEPASTRPQCDAALIGPDVEDIPCVLLDGHTGLHMSTGNGLQWEG